MLAIDGAANGDAGAENFLNGALEFGGVALGSHLLGNGDDLVQLEFAVVDDVLDLLAVTWGFLKGLDDEGSGSGQHSDVALAILDHDLNKDLDALPGGSGLLDIFTDLFGWHTDGGALGSESGSSSHLTTDNLHVDILLFVRINGTFGRHFVLFLPIN